MRTFHLRLLLFVLLISLAASAQTTDAQRLQQLDAYIQKTMKEWNVPGIAVAVVKDDKVIFEKGYGVRRLGESAPVDANTIFAIASNSKAFTAATLGILVDEGKVSWDDPATKHLKGFQLYDPYVTREITIRDLLSHRSGLRTFGGDLLWYEATYPREEVLRRIRYLKPNTSFRSRYGYQNVMFLAAAEIVPAVVGKSWDEFVKERILMPLGMTRTTTTVRDLPRMDNVATPHNESGGKLRAIPYGNVNGAGGAANMNSSVHELAQWMRLQLGRGAVDGKRIFSETVSREMWTPHTISSISPESEKSIPSRHFSLYGLGWGLSDYMGKKIVSHGGALDGMFSATALVPEANFGIVVLTNSETSAYAAIWRKALDLFLDAPARDWSAEMLQQYREDKKEEAEEEKKVEEARAVDTRLSKWIPTFDPGLSAIAALGQYAGTYNSELYGDVTVELQDSSFGKNRLGPPRLLLRFAPSKTLVADLEHWHYDTFLIKWQPSVSYNFTRRGFVTFILGADGKVTEMKIDQPNPDFHFFELELKRKNP